MKRHFLHEFISLPRSYKRVALIITDIFTLIFSLWASFALRLGEWYFPQGDIIWLILAAPVLAIPAFFYFGLYRAIIRYIGFLAIWSVAKGISLYSLLLGVLLFLSGTEDDLPRSVIIINWIFSMLLVGSSRMLARWWVAGLVLSGNPLNANAANQKAAIIYGAGAAGIQLASALFYSRTMVPVAFIDDDPALQNQQINGINTYAFNQFNMLIDEYEADEILIALPSVSRLRRNEIYAMLEPFPVRVRTLPGVSDIASGKVTLDDLREISVEDLLGRDVVPPDETLLEANVRNKVVMVTGAGGSIGSELCREILLLSPVRLILFELNEFALYSIEKELLDMASTALHVADSEESVVPIQGNVTNQRLLEKVCKTFSIQTIYHAAANKHVPMVEKNTIEGCFSNAIGTRNCAQAALNAGVDTFVLISTDKAVRPTNTMGATKRLAELTLQAFAENQDATRFTMVRFGNVLDSSGSVIPLFKSQIKAGGPVTVTHPRMIRYFMTITEAAQLVIQAGAMGIGGDVFVLDMGEPVRILKLAKRMIRLSGLEIQDEHQPYGDIRIEYTGLRPGEKLYEELLIGDNVSETEHSMIMRAEEDRLPLDELEAIYSELEDAVETFNYEKVRAVLLRAIPGFKPQCDIMDLMYPGVVQAKPLSPSITQGKNGKQKHS